MARLAELKRSPLPADWAGLWHVAKRAVWRVGEGRSGGRSKPKMLEFGPPADRTRLANPRRTFA
jgi:hypothetical protein